jgi:lysophospholipase L1-like esterase
MGSTRISIGKSVRGSRLLAVVALGGLALTGCSGGASGPASPPTNDGVGGATVVTGSGGAAGAAVDAGARDAAGSAGASGTGGAPTTSGTGGRAGTGGAPAADAGSVDAGATDASKGDAGRADAGTGVTMTCNTAGAATAKTPTVWVIGDSTASVYTSDLYPRMGWAQPLQEYFTPACATIQDKALSGRSSKSFFDEGDWTPIKAALRAGDIVLIQFGHNDEKSDDPIRFTDPFTTYEMYLSIYIDDSLAKGATPILLSSINRNSWSNGVLSDTHGNYPVAVRQLAAAKKVALCDATALTKTYFTRLGQTATTALFMDLAPGQFPNYPTGNTDDTHLQDKGAHTIAQLILADMYRQAFPLASLLKAVPQAP